MLDPKAGTQLILEMKPRQERMWGSIFRDCEIHGYAHNKSMMKAEEWVWWVGEGRIESKPPLFSKSTYF